MKPASADEVKALRNLTGCGMMDAKKALEERDNDIEFAIEYLQRRNLAVVMSDEARFPKWTRHVKMFGRTK